MYLDSGYYIGLIVRREQMAQLYEIRAQLSSWLSIVRQWIGSITGTINVMTSIFLTKSHTQK
ncbi:hypothetical protein HC752_01575 [Vibrio sp. S9_S30]|uniref:hypothetical protein n=1 Tax=Vibrio sp. S9_S30 TaxID=2720226 RepID=UPI0016815128|nr:hypothetical protein [Vibrio sp. S9_S30]MBD1555623.1 hypothetical protein [Vibrio sp. S9_S30]